MSDYDLQGSVSVSRSAAVGGGASVGGHLAVGHNLFVKGWVDAPHIKGALKGLYASEEALVRAYPRPQPGWYALVGDALPADVWRAEGGTWVPTGEQGGEPELWLDDLQGRMDEAEEAIEAEAEERRKADEGLSSAIEAEAEERRKGDAELSRAVAEEAEERRMGDAAILGSVEIGELDSVSVAEAMASVIGRGPHRFDVMDQGKLVGTLEVMGDEMGHVYSQVLVTHRLIDEQGRLTDAHRDDRMNILYRSFGLREGGIPVGAWTPWRRMQAELVQVRGDSTEVAMSQKAVSDELDAISDDIRDIRAHCVMAVEVDGASGDVVLLFDEDNTSLADAYVNERGEIVIEQMIDGGDGAEPGAAAAARK